jgi:hypothetical protein
MSEVSAFAHEASAFIHYGATRLQNLRRGGQDGFPPRRAEGGDQKISPGAWTISFRDDAVRTNRKRNDDVAIDDE